jgi:hypothetical protein
MSFININELSLQSELINSHPDDQTKSSLETKIFDNHEDYLKLFSPELKSIVITNCEQESSGEATYFIKLTRNIIIYREENHSTINHILFDIASSTVQSMRSVGDAVLKVHSYTDKGFTAAELLAGVAPAAIVLAPAAPIVSAVELLTAAWDLNTGLDILNVTKEEDLSAYNDETQQQLTHILTNVARFADKIVENKAAKVAMSSVSLVVGTVATIASGGIALPIIAGIGGATWIGEKIYESYQADRHQGKIDSAKQNLEQLTNLSKGRWISYILNEPIDFKPGYDLESVKETCADRDVDLAAKLKEKGITEKQLKWYLDLTPDMILARKEDDPTVTGFFNITTQMHVEQEQDVSEDLQNRSEQLVDNMMTYCVKKRVALLQVFADAQKSGTRIGSEQELSNLVEAALQEIESDEGLDRLLTNNPALKQTVSRDPVFIQLTELYGKLSDSSKKPEKNSNFLLCSGASTGEREQSNWSRFISK